MTMPEDNAGVNGNGERQTAGQVLSQILDRLDSDDHGRAIPFYRVRELCPPFTKAHCFQLLHDGRLRGVKIGDALLISEESVRELLEQAPSWSGTK